LNGEQNKAFNNAISFLAMGGGGFFLLNGKAGVGKTYLSARIISYIVKEMKLRIAVTAPTHKAVRVLKDFVNSDDDTFTTHAFLGMREEIDINGKQVFKPTKLYDIPADNYGIVIVDEASMVPDVIFDELEKRVKQRNLKVIFVGDKLQIPPVGLPNSLPFDIPTQRDLAFTVSELHEIVRQAKGNPIIEIASHIREGIFKAELGLNYQSKAKGLIGVSYIDRDRLMDHMPEILSMFASEEFKNNSDYIKILAWTNKQVIAYNKMVRKHLFGDVPDIVPGDKLVSDAPLMEGKNVLVQNNTDMEVLEVDIRTEDMGGAGIDYYRTKVRVYAATKIYEVYIKIIHEQSEKLFNMLLKKQAEIAQGYQKGSYQSKSAWMDYYSVKSLFHAVKHGYSLTSHKGQGSTYDHAVVDMTDIMRSYNIQERNRIFYTACTRPKYGLKIIH